MTTAARRTVDVHKRSPRFTDPPKQQTAFPPGTRFVAELHLAELDDRGRPGGVGTGRALDRSRSHLTFRSRRMCHLGRELIVIVHLVDDRPVALLGTVRACEYDGEGLYKTRLELVPIPNDPELATWIRARDARGTLYSPPA